MERINKIKIKRSSKDDGYYMPLADISFNIGSHPFQYLDYINPFTNGVADFFVTRTFTRHGDEKIKLCQDIAERLPDGCNRFHQTRAGLVNHCSEYDHCHRQVELNANAPKLRKQCFQGTAQEAKHVDYRQEFCARLIQKQLRLPYNSVQSGAYEHLALLFETVVQQVPNTGISCRKLMGLTHHCLADQHSAKTA